jgi:hypothetical protein
MRFVKFNKKKAKNKTSTRHNNQNKAMGMFLAWMALYWMFICILAISLISKV